MGRRHLSSHSKTSLISSKTQSLNHPPIANWRDNEVSSDVNVVVSGATGLTISNDLSGVLNITFFLPGP